MQISLAIHRNFRNWRQLFSELFYNRSGSNTIHALPILIFLVCRLPRDQVVLHKTAANLSVSRRQANDFFAFFSIFGRELELELNIPF